jgi:predicted acyl esterase
MRLTLFLLIFLPFPLFAQLNPEPINIPMRDGQELAADLYLPNQTDSFPVILIQTPYNKNFYKFVGLPLGIGYGLDDSPYAFVILDWRCFWGSIGACTLNPNRGEDGYDAVEWIAEQSWSDGKVGTWGPSALGGVQFSTAYEQPPHLVCAVPEVAAPWETYHKYYPGGSIKVEQMETLQFLFGDFSLVINNPYYNLLWQIAEGSTMKPESVEVPMLLVAGWFDHNTEWDMILIDTLANASPTAVKDQHKILIGPWVHGGTGQAAVGTEQQGELSFPEAAGWNHLLETEFFDYHLRGIANGWDERERYIYFQMGDNIWEESEVWPPEEVQYHTLFLFKNGEILPYQSDVGLDKSSFFYDPEDPSPTIGGKTLNDDLLQGPYDQSAEVESRPDVLLFSTPVLEDPLEVQGKIKTRLYVSSDRPDTDFTLRLTDVYLDGRSILLGESILRMRFREGFTEDDESFLTPNEVYPITLEFDDLAHTFLPDHQLRLIVSSSNYPRYNRNMNTGGEMYPNDNIDTLVNPNIAENTLYFNPVWPSAIELPLANPISSVVHVKEKELELDVFPNPSSSHFTLKGEGIKDIQVFDRAGREITKFSLQKGERSFIISDLEPGYYLFRIKTDRGVISRAVLRK